MFESFNQYIGGSPPLPLKTVTPTPNRALYPAAGLQTLLSQTAAVQRSAFIPFLQDNIVPLVGADAAKTLGPLLDVDNFNVFVQQALTFQLYLERGFQTYDDALKTWRDTKGGQSPSPSQ
jgi:hypothetical protein